MKRDMKEIIVWNKNTQSIKFSHQREGTDKGYFYGWRHKLFYGCIKTDTLDRGLTKTAFLLYK